MGSIGDIGLQGLGTLVRIIDLATALKHGNLGGALQRQAGLLTNPETSGVVEGSPFLAGFTGAYGSRRPTAVDAAPGGPSLPEPVSQFHANLPVVLKSLDDQLKEARLGLTQAQTKAMQAGPPPGYVQTGYDSTGKATYTNPETMTPIRTGATERLTGGTGQRPRIEGTPSTPEQVVTAELAARGLTPGTPEYTNAFAEAMAKQGAGTRPAPQALVNSITQGNDMLASLANVQNLAEKAQARQGPIMGRLGRGLNDWGFNTQEQSQFLAAIERLQNAYRLATTGQQASYQELERIRKQLPNENQNPTAFKAALIEAAKATLRTVMSKTQGAKDISRAAPDLVVPPEVAQLLEQAGSPITTTTPGTSTTSTTIPPGAGQQIKPRDVSATVNDLNSMTIPGVAKIRRGR